ncbi:KAR9-domain-containing protein, partial [Saccharata proteae CBS 121410]
RALRKPSPGLLARMKLLDVRNKARAASNGLDKIGRIPESQIRELDSLHQNLSIRVERRGSAWSGPGLCPQLTGGSLPEPNTEGLHSQDSNISSMLSTSDRMAHSDRDHSDIDSLEASRLDHTTQARGDSVPTAASRDDIDLELSTDQEIPPTPPLKDLPPSPVSPPADLNLETQEGGASESYFNPHGLSRAASIYTLSRVSFTSQLSQLTSIRLPEAASLSSSIAAIPTANAAAKALDDAGGQIRAWIKKAGEVLSGLDAEDDVEWAAAGGREGLDEVDAAIRKFETLIQVFVVAIDHLQSRDDASSLPRGELPRLVGYTEVILNNWDQIKARLHAVKNQVEIAMEWEELWSVVLGEIGLEMEALSRLVFEMEERRHRSVLAECLVESSNGLDIETLQTIVEETPTRNTRLLAGNGSNLSGLLNPSTPEAPGAHANEDFNLLSLSARTQPLRASLDFIPMRLSQFQQRASSVFPSACEELENRRISLERQWRKLDGDANSLKRELGEDRWVATFRSAAKTAQEMCKVVEQNLAEVQEALDEELQHKNVPAMLKLIEGFEGAKMHWAPGIEKVLRTIDNGVKNRLTVNGEILCLQSDMRRVWSDLQARLKMMEQQLEGLSISKNQQLRDSVSTIVSMEPLDQSVSSSVVETPGSSPASSVILTSRKSSEQELTTPYFGLKSRQSSFASSPKSQTNNMVSRSSASEASPSPTLSRYSSATPTPSRRFSTSPSSKSDKPRWNASTSMKETIVGHYHRMAATEAPSERKDKPGRTLRSVASHSAIPKPSPLSRNSMLSPPPSSLPRPASTTPAAASSARRPVSIAQPPRTPSRSSWSRMGFRTFSSTLPTNGYGKRQSAFLEPFAIEDSGRDSPSGHSPSGKRPSRPSSVMASGRRSSMLPMSRNKASGRESQMSSRD